MSAELFATSGDENDLERVWLRSYWAEDAALFDAGPTVELLEVGALHSNAWHVEPALRARYVEVCRSGSLPVPLEVEAARPVSWSHVSATGDGWGPFVLEGDDARALDAGAYAMHAAVLLEVHGRSVEELLELRARPCLSGWSFDTDPDFQQLYTRNEGSNA